MIQTFNGTCMHSSISEQPKLIVNARKHYPFKVVSKSGKPIIEVEIGQETKQLTAEEVSIANISTAGSHMFIQDICHGSWQNEGNGRSLPWA